MNKPRYLGKITRILITIIIVGLVALMLYGIIDERSFINNVWYTFLNFAKDVYNDFSGVHQSPVDVSNKGIYLQGHTPAN